MTHKRTTLGELREMIEKYKDYLLDAEHLEGKVLEMLTLRDEIEELLHRLEKKGTELSAERTRLESLDHIGRKKAKIILRHLRACVDLTPYREERNIPTSHWWWYLDDLIKEKKFGVARKWLVRGGIAAIALVCAYVVLTRIIPKPEPAVLLQEEASRLYEEGKIDEAIAVYKKALRMSPKDSSIYLTLGVLYEDKGLSDEANYYFDRAKKLFPKEIAFYNQRGMIYFQKGKLDKATSDAKETLKIDPDSATAHFLLGSIYEVQGKIGEAISEYQIVSNLDTDPKLTVMARVKMGMLIQRAVTPPSR